MTCTKTKGSNGPAGPYWVKYELKFEGNPGAHRVPEIIVLDDAGRHTLRDDTTVGTQFNGLDTTVVYDTGITGEFYDFFGKKCGVTVQIMDPATFYADPDGLYGLTDVTEDVHYGEVQRAYVGTSAQLRTLKECLADSDGVSSNNVGVENWDLGSLGTEAAVYGPENYASGGTYGNVARTIRQAVPGQFPHMVKLVNAAASTPEFEGGMYTIMSYHTVDENFVLSAAVDPSLTYQVCTVRLLHSRGVRARSFSRSVIPCFYVVWSHACVLVATTREDTHAPVVL